MTDVDKRQMLAGTTVDTSACRLVLAWVSYVRNYCLFTPAVEARHSYVRTTREHTKPTEAHFSYVRSIARTTASSIPLPHAATSKSRYGTAFTNSIFNNFVYISHCELISEFSYVRTIQTSCLLDGKLISYVRKSDMHATQHITQSSYVRNHMSGSSDASEAKCISYVRTAATPVVSHSGEHSYVRKLNQLLTHRSLRPWPLFAKSTPSPRLCQMDMPPPSPRKVRHRYRLIQIQQPKPPRNPRGFLLPDQKLHFARLGLPGSDGRSHFGDAK